MQTKSKISLNFSLEKIVGIIVFIGSLFMLYADYIYTPVSSDSWDWWTFLTFTFLTNISIGIIYILRGFKIIDNSTYSQQVLQMVLNSLFCVAFLTYWLLLASTTDAWDNPVTSISSSWTHGLSPVLVVALFIWQTFNIEKHKIKWVHAFYVLIFPVTWLIMQQIMSYTASIYFYTILDPNDHSYAVIYVYVLAILALCLGLSYIFIVLNNKIQKNNLKNVQT